VNRRSHRRTAASLAVAATLLVPCLAAAGSEDSDDASREARFADSHLLTDRWGVSAGAFLVELRTDAQVGFGKLLGSRVRLEETLGLDRRQTTWRFDGFYRFRPRHALEVGLYRVNRESSGVIESPIDFEDTRFVGEHDSLFRMGALRTMYKYSFINDGRVNAGIAAGLSTFEFDLGIEGESVALDPNGDPIGGIEFKEEQNDFFAPVPAAGIFLEYAILPNFVFRSGLEIFDLTFGDYEVRLVETGFSFDYAVARHFGLGVGADTTDISYVDTDGTLRVDYRFSGVIGFVTVAF
jgi:hypothetical protein